jgi:uncharacterized protein YdhG (YjbR/CyaY superfamily)
MSIMKTPVDKVASIDQYIRGFPEDVQITLSELRLSIRFAAPEATEKISYRMPTFYFNGNLVHFAAFAHHIGFYPTPGGIDGFQQELKVYNTSKGAIQFPLDQPLPLKLITKIVRFRVKENAQKAQAKR